MARRSHGRPAVDEQDGASVLAQKTHAGNDLVHRRDGAVDREFNRTDKISRRCFQYRMHEVLLRQGAVLQDLDRAESFRYLLEHPGNRCRIPHVGDETLRRDSFFAQFLGQGIHAPLIARDQRNGKSFCSETTRYCCAESFACTDNCDSSHIGCKTPLWGNIPS